MRPSCQRRVGAIGAGSLSRSPGERMPSAGTSAAAARRHGGRRAARRRSRPGCAPLGDRDPHEHHRCRPQPLRGPARCSVVRGEGLVGRQLARAGRPASRRRSAPRSRRGRGSASWRARRRRRGRRRPARSSSQPRCGPDALRERRLGRGRREHPSDLRCRVDVAGPCDARAPRRRRPCAGRARSGRPCTSSCPGRAGPMPYSWPRPQYSPIACSAKLVGHHAADGEDGRHARHPRRAPHRRSADRRCARRRHRRRSSARSRSTSSTRSVTRRTDSGTVASRALSNS